MQESWLRFSRSGSSEVENLGGWLTTIVARVCLDMLRARKSRREEPLDGIDGESIGRGENGLDPEAEAIMADAAGAALLVVLETLEPAERVAFVLHDVFAVPFEEVAAVVGRSPAAARQLASRARRRVQAAGSIPRPDLTRQREIVDAFLAASRRGDLRALLALLDPDVALRADAAAVGMGSSAEVRGAAAVADNFSGRARAAQPALLNGKAGLVWAPGGTPRVAFAFMFARDKIVAIDMVADHDTLKLLDPEFIQD